MGALIAFRFLAGMGGSACLTIGGGVISDSFSVENRGMANSVFTIGPLFGPVLGPILGGFITQRATWRWVYWVLLIACSIASIVTAATYRETSHSVLLRKKSDQLRASLQNLDLVSFYDKDCHPLRNGTWDVLHQGIKRPIRFLVKSPIVPLLATYMSFVFGLLYLLLTTVTNVFRETNGWSLELCGLANLGLGLGFAVGLITVAKTSDKTVIRLTKSNGSYKPEMRLFTCIIFAFFVPISFFWYGWATEKRAHWIVQILGLAPFGFGMMGIFAPIQTYFIDIGGPYAASVLAGLTATRCTVGAFLPLAGPSMYSALGLGWGNSLLGFVAFALIPVPMLIYRFGGDLREKYPLHTEEVT
jgi:MFS family permease